MKNRNMPLILAVIISDICGEDKVTNVRNSGSKKQCVPKPAFCLNFAKEDFAFATATASRTKVAWDAAKENNEPFLIALMKHCDSTMDELRFLRKKKIEFGNSSKISVNKVIGYWVWLNPILKAMIFQKNSRIFLLNF